MPGFYQGVQIDEVNWGIKDDFHMAYLVPANTDRRYIVNNLLESVQNGILDMNTAGDAIAKIVTYDEFLAFKGTLNQKNMFKIKKSSKAFLKSNLLEFSI